MNQYLDAAIKAARAAGALKVESDVRFQALITELLLEKFPDHAILAKKATPRMPPPSLSG
jgi:hypothetical protein